MSADIKAPERCPTCDRPVATKAHWAERDSRGGRSGIAVRGAMRDIEKRDGVCMVTGWIHGCAKHAAPWRARALAAEAELAGASAAICDVSDTIRRALDEGGMRAPYHGPLAVVLRYPSIAADLRRLDEVLTIGSPRAAAMRAAAAQWAKVAPLIERLRDCSINDGDDPQELEALRDAILAATEATP